MLIDDMIASCSKIVDATEHRADLRHMRAATEEYRDYLRSAAVYALDEDVALFMDSLTPDMEKTLATFADLEMPHDLMMIEFPFREVDRIRTERFDLKPLGAGPSPKRVGVLLRRDGNEVYASLGYSGAEDGSAELPPFEMPMSKLQAVAETSRGVGVNSQDVILRVAAHLTHNIAQGAMSDISSELALAMVFVLVLNDPDREAVYDEPVDLDRLNRSRTKSGREPLREHRRMRLGELGKLHLKAVDDEAAAARAGRRAHYVRGHYFRSHGKLVWRRPHVRGMNADGSDPSPPVVRMGM